MKMQNEKEIGRRFMISYKHIFPSNLTLNKYNTFLINKRYPEKTMERVVLFDTGNGIYKDLYEYNDTLYEIKDIDTIVEYIGHNEYKDLITGENFIIKKDQIIDNIKNPFQMYTRGLSPIENEVTKQESEIYLKSIDKEEIKKITFCLKQARINMIKNNLIKKLNLTESEIYQDKVNQIDNLQIGQTYTINYSNLKPTLTEEFEIKEDFPTLDNQDLLETLTYNLYTIIEYCGNDIYLDLTTGIYITSKKKTKIETKKDYEYITKYPLSIEKKYLRYISKHLKKKMSKIDKNTKKKIKKNLEKYIITVNLQLENNENKPKIKRRW